MIGRLIRLPFALVASSLLAIGAYTAGRLTGGVEGEHEARRVDAIADALGDVARASIRAEVEAARQGIAPERAGVAERVDRLQEIGAINLRERDALRARLRGESIDLGSWGEPGLLEHARTWVAVSIALGLLLVGLLVAWLRTRDRQPVLMETPTDGRAAALDTSVSATQAAHAVEVFPPILD